MKRYVDSFTSLLVLPIIISAVMAIGAAAQRANRDYEGTPIIASGTRTIPSGTFILLEMETRLDSKESRRSDRFRARVAAPVVNAEGQTLIPEAAYVEGHVSAVAPAKWARRSGLISVDFDYLFLPNGESIPLRGYLTSADAEDRRRIDEEGNIKGGPPRKRDIVFIGGGAASGAAIGMIAGGALAGAGIGAAVGLSATLLMKGREAVVEQGQRIALGLTEELRVPPAPEYLAPRQPENERSSYEPPRPSTRPVTPETRRPTYSDAPDGRTTEANQTGGAVNLSTITSERGNDGLIRILITAETPTANWRIYTNHEIRPDMVEIRLRGVAPTAPATPQLSHPSAPAIIIPDRSSRIKKIVIYAKNTTETIGVNGTWTNRNRTASRPRPTTQGDRASLEYRPESAGQDGLRGSALVSQIQKEIELIRYNYASSIGIWINKNGTIESLSTRRPTRDEEKFLESLAALYFSVQALENNSPTAGERRNNLLKVREDYQTVETIWRRIPMSTETNRQVREMLSHVDQLLRQS
ncbi:MAG: hypothetical protein ACK5RR_11010 [Acidobacteriota bacterium]